MLLVIAMAFFVTGVVALAFPISILTDSGIDALNLKALGAASMVVSALLSLALLRGGGSSAARGNISRCPGRAQGRGDPILLSCPDKHQGRKGGSPRIQEQRSSVGD